MRHRLIFTGIMSLGMSCLVGLFVTYVNTGFDAGLPLRWVKAWVLAFPVAWITAFFWSPLAQRITKFMM